MVEIHSEARTGMHVGSALGGSKCPDCGVMAYPQVSSCPQCGTATVVHELSQHGTVWSWTVQRFPPKSPPYVIPEGGHVPFVVAYIELDEGLRVEAVVEAAPGEMGIGMAVDIWSGNGVPRASVRKERR